MKSKTLYLIWGGLFILCGLLGFIVAVLIINLVLQCVR